MWLVCHAPKPPMSVVNLESWQWDDTQGVGLECRWGKAENSAQTCHARRHPTAGTVAMKELHQVSHAGESKEGFQGLCTAGKATAV